MRNRLIGCGLVLGFAGAVALSWRSSPAEASRTSTGIYALPSGNPVVAGSYITPSWANSTLPDLGNEISNSLDRRGRGAMLAPLVLFDGSNINLALTFTSDRTAGLYRAGPSDIRMQVNGSTVQQWADGFSTFTGSLSCTATSSYQNALSGTGNGTGAGVIGQGGTTNGAGVQGIGGASGTGVVGTGGASGGKGVYGQGTGAASGIRGIGGATAGAIGGEFTGGAGGGPGVYTTGTGASYGVQAIGGPSAGAAGGIFSVQATNGAGILSFGNGTGNGGSFTGGSSNGNGISATGAGSGNGVFATGGGTSGSGILATGGGTGPGINGLGGASNGIGVLGTGAGAGAGGKFISGTAATTTAMTYSVIAHGGHILFEAVANPTPGATGVANTITPKNIAKAWAYVVIQSGGVVMQDGFNVSSCGLTGTGTSTTVHCNVSSGFTSPASMGVTAGNSIAGANYITWYEVTATRGSTSVDFRPLNGTTAIDISSGGPYYLNFIIFGAQ